MFGIAAVAAAITLAAPQEAPPTPQAVPAQSAPSTQLSDVVVERDALRDLIRTFVDEVADPLPGYGPARWDGRVCVRVVYLRPELARFMVDRIYAVARRAGLRTGAAGCRPNILIVAAADGEEMARAMVDARPGLFLTHVSGANRQSADLDEFQAADSPVRWWHISLPVNADTGQAAVRLPGQGPGVSSGETGSRLRTELQNDLQRVFIIVDFNRASGSTIRQLSDYVAMVSLAQIDPDADPSAFDTILNLFDGRPAPPELTTWDRDYLRALYDARLDQRQPNAQLEAVARTMLRNRQTEAEAGPQEQGAQVQR